MYILESYPLAVAFCVLTMLCWGSWANTQKLAGKTWRFELFYWDYVIGVFLLSTIFALTVGSSGEFGRGFVEDLQQASPEALGSAFAGGVVFNLANILLVAAIAIAGMSVAFPVGIGLALVLGVLLNYWANPAASGNPVLLFSGVALITAAIVINAMAYGRLPKDENASGGGAKGLVLSVVCGVLMSLFYYFVARALAGVQVPGTEGVLPVTIDNLKNGTLEAGKMSAYTANFVFALGILISNFVINTAIQLKPFVGTPVSPLAYFKGTFRDHIWGIIGGCIWGVGMSANIVAANVASPAVAYGLGQGATIVSAIWGVFIWREFRNAKQGTGPMLAVMFALFIVGLTLLIVTKL